MREGMRMDGGSEERKEVVQEGGREKGTEGGRRVEGAQERGEEGGEGMWG